MVVCKKIEDLERVFNNNKTTAVQPKATYLEMNISNVLSQRNPCLSINNLHPDWSIALCLQDIVDEILWSEVYVAAPVRIVLT